jgi:hypothetical protein
MKGKAKIICGYHAVGGNYNSPRDSRTRKRKPVKQEERTEEMKLMRKSILPIIVILIIAAMGKCIYMVDGQIDWFRLCMVFGVPFGIPYMTIIIPLGRGVSVTESSAVMLLSAIIGALFGAVIAAVVFIKAIVYLIWFTISKCKRLIFR